jgi:hypothetical protein
LRPPSPGVAAVPAEPVAASRATAHGRRHEQLAPRASRKALRRAGERGLGFVAAWSFPLLLLALAVIPRHLVYGYAWDFRALYDAGGKYLELRSPYTAASLADLTSKENFVYPLPVAALFAPLSLVPYPVAAIVFVGTSAVLLGLALRILGVSDWRCYAAAYLSLPVQMGLKFGTISPLLAFLLALAWRYRNRTAVAAPVLALAVISKLFLWPVALWFLFTRRFRSFLVAVGISVALLLSTTLPLGFGPLLHYPALVHAVSSFESPQSISLFAFLHALGLSPTTTLAGAGALGTLLVALAYRWARADESRAFRALVLASLILSPLVWGHYFVILFVTLALARPRFSALWFGLSWVMYDGYVLGPNLFLVMTGIALAVMVAQAGVVDIRKVRSLLRLGRGVRLGSAEAMIALWPVYLLTSAGMSAATPAVAALRPPSGQGGASGTAAVRLLHNRSAVCWRVWVAGVPPGSSVELVSGQRRVVAAHVLARDSQRETCVPVARREAAQLVETYGRTSGNYRLEVRSRASGLLLQGRLLRQVDAGVAAEGAPR